MKGKIKKIMLFTMIISIIAVASLIIAMVIEINKMYSEYRQNIVAVKDEQANNKEDDMIENYEEANSGIGKTIEEIKQEEQKEKKDETKDNTTSKNESKTKTENKKNEEKQEEKKVEKESDPVFEKPLEGEVIKEYNKENLVYSETLKEWTTHAGIDIKAELSTVVKSAENGTVTAIKNDPRYGITVIVTHTNGYETRYSNLLTAEFITEGEKVTKGQTIGTVGNTASFEVADSPHLHFEILKDSESLDPQQVIKY